MIFSGNKSCFLVSSSSVGRFLPPGFHFSMPGGSIPALSTPQFPLLSSWAGAHVWGQGRASSTFSTTKIPLLPFRAVLPLHFLPLKFYFSHLRPQQSEFLPFHSCFLFFTGRLLMQRLSAIHALYPSLSPFTFEESSIQSQALFLS